MKLTSHINPWVYPWQLIVLPIALVLLLYLPYLAMELMDPKYEYAKIFFHVNVIHIPIALFTLLSLISSQGAKALFLLWFNLTFIVRAFEVGIQFSFGLGFSPMVFDQIDFGNFFFALKQESLLFVLLIIGLVLINFIAIQILRQYKVKKMGKALLILLVFLGVRGAWILEKEWWHVYEELALVSFAQQLNSYQEIRNSKVDIRFSDKEKEILESQGIRLLPPKVIPPIERQKLNIITVFLESFQRNFTNIDQEREKSWTPFLDEFLKENTNSLMYNALVPTLNSVIGAECGLWPQLSNQDLRKDNSYSYGLLCLGDFLKEIGYKQIYITGSSPSFANKKKFYLMHGFDEFIGREEIFQEFPEYEKRRHGWGVQDLDLMNYTTQWLGKQNFQKPFRLFLSTTNSHVPGHIGPNCPEVPDENHPFYRVIHCVDLAFGNFWRWFQKSTFAENTILMVVGDHPAFFSPEEGTKKIRKKLYDEVVFGFYHPLKKDFGTIPPASLTDFAPTILELLGARVEHFRAGNSILSQKKQFPSILSPKMTVIEGKQNVVASCKIDQLRIWEIKNKNIIAHECSLAKIKLGLEKIH